MADTEAVPNWLSKSIEEARASVNRVFSRRERKAEMEAIVAAIRQEPRGKPLIDHSDLNGVIEDALDLADALELKAKRHPTELSISPAIQASWLIFDKLDLSRPEPEF